MHGRWRLFRHDAGRSAGPPAWAYVALFAACMAVGYWSAANYQAVVAWPANGVMLAALLQLRRREAILVLAACVAINLGGNIVRGDSQPFVWVNVLSNLIQVLVAGGLARRFCGAALDMRRPRRLARFVLLAAAPAVTLTATLMVALATALRGYSPSMAAFLWGHLFSMELLGLLIVTPSLLLLARAHRFAQVTSVSRTETALLFGLLVGAVVVAFGQSATPTLYLVIPALVLIAFRLSPPWTAAALILTTVLSGWFTLTGGGPVSLTQMAFDPELAGIPPLMRRMGVFHIFLIVAALTALPVSTFVTERRRLTARLTARTAAALAARRRAEESDAAKSRFLALMSHEMRTPLNGVTGYADLLTRRDDLAPDAREHVEAVQRSSDALLMLVEDVLEFSRGGEEVRPEPFALADLLAEASAPARLAAEAKRLDVVLEIAPGDDGRFSGDRRRLRQALHHLIGNAVKFTDSGEVRVRADHDGERLTVSVADTGCGIAPDLAPRLFEAFAQGDDSIRRRHMGAGVGLALVKAQADRLGGRITFESTPGAGSVFTLTIPLERLAEPPAAPVDAEAPDGPLRVLIVDDHPVNREMVRLMLTVVGCETAEAVDGLDAVEKAASAPFHLILMDVRMPRMDGLAAAQRIRALPLPVADVPILALTADAMPEDAARCLAAGMNGHLAKPITQARLCAAVEAVLAENTNPAAIVNAA